jgi:hypothetical protein
MALVLAVMAVSGYKALPAATHEATPTEAAAVWGGTCVGQDANQFRQCSSWPCWLGDSANYYNAPVGGGSYGTGSGVCYCNANNTATVSGGQCNGS